MFEKIKRLYFWREGNEIKSCLYEVNDGCCRKIPNSEEVFMTCESEEKAEEELQKLSAQG